MPVKVLLVAWSRLGDGVIATGVAAAVLARHPDARLTVAAGPLAAPLFAAMPRLERLIVLEKQPRGGHWWHLWRAVAGQRWDEVIDLRGSALAYLLRARQRRVLRGTPAPISKYAEIGRLIGVDGPLSPQVWTTTADRREAARLVPDGPPVLALAPGANFPAKAWPADRFAALAARLTGEGGPMAGMRVAGVGGPGEEDLVAAALAPVPPARRLMLAGALPIPVFGAALARAALFVGNDSGMMHLAAAAGTPTLGLFGPSDPRVYAPVAALATHVGTEIPHAELIRRIPAARAPGELMTSLAVDTVEAAARDLWARAEAHRSRS